MKRMAQLGAIKLSLRLQELATPAYFEQHSNILFSDANAELLQACLEGLRENAAERPEEGSPQAADYVEATGYALLCDLLEQDELAITCLELAALAFSEPMAVQVITELSYGSSHGPTMESAAMVLYQDYNLFSYYEQLQQAFARIKRLLLPEGKDQPFFRRGLQIDSALCNFFCGHSDEPMRGLLRCLVSEELDAPAIFSSMLDEASTMLHTAETTIVMLTGEALSGRKFFARHLARQQNRELLILSYPTLTAQSETEREWLLFVAVREALITDAILCLEDVSFGEESAKSRAVFLTEMLEPLLRNSPLLFVTAAKNVKLAPFVTHHICEIALPAPQYEDRRLLWEHYSRKHLPQLEIPCAELAARMKLVPGQVERALQRLAFLGKSSYSIQEICKVCYQVLDDGRYENVMRVETTYTWDDLKLEKTEKDCLIDICNQMRYRLKVLIDWKLGKKFPYGKGISALFAGPPGTGKTMAAHVLASMLGLELFKVDLSQVVDKYIGETEKRLEQIFTRAEKSSMILFFDEADAVFGKRTDVTDAKDKYANTEVSYILQRIEEYDGIVILATNFQNNIDEAFRRRLRYKIDFQLPDKAMRRSIWESVFTPEMQADDIDFDYLASRFELSGGVIKNIILNAAFLAAAEEQSVQMRHLLRCVRNENMKLGKTMPLSEFGEYASILEEESR